LPFSLSAVKAVSREDFSVRSLSFFKILMVGNIESFNLSQNPSKAFSILKIKDLGSLMHPVEQHNCHDIFN
jgi:hypothetical protein